MNPTNEPEFDENDLPDFSFTSEDMKKMFLALEQLRNIHVLPAYGSKERRQAIRAYKKHKHYDE